MNSELWREVPSAPGYYARIDGAIMGRRGKVLKAGCLVSGYPTVGVPGDDRKVRFTYVHRMVAEAWLGPCPDGYEVDHKDETRDNNRAENLQYLTKDQNREKSQAARCKGTGRWIKG